jgi:alcohol dehydrogenase
MAFVPSCGHCRPCLEGRPALCEPGNAANAAGELLSGHKPFSDSKGESLYQHMGLSAFSRQTVVAESSLLPLPDDLPLDLAALLGCSILTGVGAAVHTAAIKPGMEVAVFGLGGVGMAAVLGARMAGAATILGIDLDEGKFPIAAGFGATACRVGGADVVEWIKANSDGGVDVTIDTAGVAGLLTDGYQATRRGGSVVIVGLANPAAMVEVSPADLVATERTIRGSYMGSTVPERDVGWLARMYRAGQLPLAELVGERLELADIPEGFAALHRGTRGRQLVAIGESR